MREYNYDKYMINCSYVQIRRDSNDNKGDQTEHSDMHKLRSRGKGAFLLLGAAGLATMWEAVFSDVGVTVLAVLNTLRIRRYHI